MVAHNTTGAGGSQTDHAQSLLSGIVIVEHVDNDRSHDTDGTPGSTGSKADESTDDEDNGGQNVHQGAGAFHGSGNEVHGIQAVAGNTAQGPSQAQDQDGGDHLAEAVGDRLHGLLEVDGTAQPEVNKGEHQTDQRADAQAGTGRAVSESIDEGHAIKEAASVDQANDAGSDQDDNGQNQIQNGTGLLAFFIIVSASEGTLLSGEQITLDLSIVLMLQHGTVVDVQQGDGNDHHQSQQAVVVVGDLLDEQLNTVNRVGLNITGNGSSPGRNGGDHADGGSGGVDDVGQLGAGDVVGLGDRTHHGADGQAVKVVVNEDQAAQQHGHQLCAGATLDGLGSPTAESSGAAALVHQVDHNAQQHQEHDDGEVGVGNDAQIAGSDLNDSIPGVELGVQQGTNQNTNEQGRIYFLADQCQADCHHGGQQGPNGASKGSGGLFDQNGSVLKGNAQNDQQHNHCRTSYQIGNLCAFLTHSVIYLLKKWYYHYTVFCVKRQEVRHRSLLFFEQIMNEIFSHFTKNRGL